MIREYSNAIETRAPTESSGESGEIAKCLERDTKEKRAGGFFLGETIGRLNG